MFSHTDDQARGTPPQVTTDASCGWTRLIARIAFRGLIAQHLDDEQAAYDTLVASGCPAHLADAVWTAHCAGGQP